MPLRRFRRPGLLGSIGRHDVIAGTPAMTSQVLEHHPEPAGEPAAAGAGQGASASSPDPSADLVSQLTELAELRSSGALSEAEFRGAKTRLLAR